MKNYKRRSTGYKIAGKSLIGITTLGGFLTYEIATDWENFQTELDNFIVVNEETIKLNMAIALPLLIAILVFLFVMRRKNKEFLKDKASLSLLIAILVSYAIYSIIAVAMASLIGAFVGVVGDEFLFTPLANSSHKKYLYNRQFEDEAKKEEIRIEARKKAREKLDGSV